MRALPASYYVEPRWAEAERACVFARGWHFIAHLSQLAGPGDHVVARAGELRKVRDEMPAASEH
ncbi:MAG TPA: hypothetical protein VM528_08620, partial [Burkholderiaceae bacterium]|nr:hypothetical protein [Burkholderiaceae bacterium]